MINSETEAYISEVAEDYHGEEPVAVDIKSVHGFYTRHLATSVKLFLISLA